MTMRATRTVLDAVVNVDCRVDEWAAALAEVALAEAVIDAARDVWMSQGGPDSLRLLGDALAAFDAAQKDGQTL